MKNTQISVIIRNKDNAETILRTLSSVFNQSLESDEDAVVLVDDGSSDDSLEKIKTAFPKLKITKTNSIGGVKALSTALSLVNRPFFTVLDADDALPSTALEVLLNAFTRPEQAASYGNYKEISIAGEEHLVDTSSNIFTTLAGGILFRTEAVKAVDGYADDLFFPEYDLLIKLMQKHQVVHVPEEVYYYFRQPGSVTSDKKKVLEGVDQITRKYGKKYPIRDY